MHQLWGYKVEEKLYVGVREQKRLNTSAIGYSSDGHAQDQKLFPEHICAYRNPLGYIRQLRREAAKEAVSVFMGRQWGLLVFYCARRGHCTRWTATWGLITRYLSQSFSYP
jgi:hypothetical protein